MCLVMRWLLFICLMSANTTYANTYPSIDEILAESTTTIQANNTATITTITDNTGSQPPIDRFESYNRNTYKFNDTLDRNVVRPAAVGYVTYVPDPLRIIIQNFFNNLRDCVTLGNDILQLNGEDSMHNLMRISINSTFGLLGIIDVSSSMGLKRHTNTFGKTLQVYGWKHSSYFIIPILGPSTVRDAVGMIPDTFFNPTWWIIPNQYSYISVGLFVVNGIDQRAKLLDYDQLLYDSIDPYSTMRDLYLQSSGEVVPTDNSNNNLDIDSIIDDTSQESGTSSKTTPNNANSNPVNSLIE